MSVRCVRTIPSTRVGMDIVEMFGLLIIGGSALTLTLWALLRAMLATPSRAESADAPASSIEQTRRRTGRAIDH